jgi:hypothetical protein
LQPAPDGSVPCALFETLPAEGPITRCAQLADFGRGAAVMGEDGRESCPLNQVVAEGETVPSGYGFFYAAEPLDEDPDRAPQRSDFLPPCYGLIGTSQPHFEFTPETALIAGSTLRLRCQLTHGAAAQPCN